MHIKTKKRKEFNNKLFEKILDFIEYFYPDIYETSREDYIHEDEERFKILKDKQNFREDYNSWFLLKNILPNGTNVIKMALSFPEDYFNNEEKQMLQNLLNYKESLFEIIEISKDGKIYIIKDLLDEKIINVKTFDLPVRFNEKDLIKAIIVKDLSGDYFFLGAITSFDIKNKKEFIEEILLKISLENKIKENIQEIEIEWEIEK